MIGNSLKGDWATLGVIVKKSAIRASKSGAPFLYWKISLLEKVQVTLFLFGSAYQAHWKESEGSVVAVFNAEALESKPVSSATRLRAFARTHARAGTCVCVCRFPPLVILAFVRGWVLYSRNVVVTVTVTVLPRVHGTGPSFLNIPVCPTVRPHAQGLHGPLPSPH